MKNLILLFLLALFAIGLNAQTVAVTGPDPAEVEIGKSYTFEAKFTGNSRYVVQSYTWSVTRIEGTGGLSGIEGLIDGSSSFENPLMNTVQNGEDMNSITVTWGDFFNPCDAEVEVTVTYDDTSTGNGNQGNGLTIKDTEEVGVFCIESLTISGQSSIQSCCENKVEYCASDLFGHADVFTWTITGGGSLSSSSINGSKCIDVIPDNTGDITITCVATRSSDDAHPNYSRSTTIVVTRFDPRTTLIDPPSFLCQEDPMEICINDLCGLSSVDWVIPNSLTIVSGQGTSCIEVVPSSTAANGSIVEITATAIMNGGCVAKPASHNIRVFSAETPPAPAGDAFIQFLDNYDPCRDENIYQIKFEAFDTYVNGITTVTPGVVIDVPHHNVGNIITVEICNLNFCSGETTCRTRRLFLPPPCQRIVQQPSDILFATQNEPRSNLKTSSPNGSAFENNFEVYPNPVLNMLNIQYSGESDGMIYVFNLNGRLVHEIQIDKNEQFQLDVSSLSNGIYYVQLKTDTGTEVKKVLVQK